MPLVRPLLVTLPERVPVVAELVVAVLLEVEVPPLWRTVEPLVVPVVPVVPVTRPLPEVEELPLWRVVLPLVVVPEEVVLPLWRVVLPLVTEVPPL